MKFPSRESAGRSLGRWLCEKSVEADVVLGLPRGGVIVAAEVAHALKCPLDVLVVRKIGHPEFPEFAVGALAEPDVIVTDKTSLDRSNVSLKELEAVIAEERQRLRDYRKKFHREGMPDLTGKIVLLVDDGLATGATMEAATLASRKQGAKKIMVVVPVASVSAVERLKRVADEVEALLIDPGFGAVGQYYEEFPQATDEEVVRLLSK